MSVSCVTIPILYPVILSLGLDPIWFGVISVLTAQMALITPPVGMNIFILKGVAPEIPLETMFRGIWPFVLADLVCIAILLHFPQIALFLPHIMLK
jgi:TRAP-type C4-dicarboxylate transport system permease large subunit